MKKEKKNTKLEKIEKKYGKDYGTSNDKDFFSFLKIKGYTSLGKLLKNA
jgi:hypothetical protein